MSAKAARSPKAACKDRHKERRAARVHQWAAVMQAAADLEDQIRAARDEGGHRPDQRRLRPGNVGPCPRRVAGGVAALIATTEVEFDARGPETPAGFFTHRGYK